LGGSINIPLKIANQRQSSCPLKTLALPILVQCLTVLPNPPESVLNDVQEIFYIFLWNGKKDKIKRSVIINEYEEGGTKNATYSILLHST
jgi:hypothetical protein